MPDILAIAEASMRNQLQQLDSISRNVANINMQSYKREIHLNRSFDTHLTAATEAALPNDGPAIDFSAGPLRRTGAALNMAIEGNGYFQLQTAQGPVLTRDGQFQLDRNGQLVALDGSPVMLQGNVALANDNFKVLGDGTVIAGDQTQGRLDVVDAAPESLQLVAPGRYRSNAIAPPSPGSFNVRQGFLEGSNVDYLKETVGMMGLMRNVQSTQQLIRAYDEVMDSAVSTLGQF